MILDETSIDVQALKVALISQYELPLVDALFSIRHVQTSFEIHFKHY